MGEKINIRVKSRFRITIPEEIREHLRLSDDDDVWYELIDNNKVVIGRTEVKKRIIE